MTDVDAAGGSQTARRWLSTSLFVFAALALGVTVACWVAGIWTHGHDTPTRLAATGFVSLLLSGLSLGLADLARTAGR